MKNGHPEPLDLLRAIWSKDSDMSQRERAYLTALLMHADNETHVCFPSQETVAAEAGSCERAARPVLRMLVARGLIRRETLPPIKGMFPGTKYTLMPEAILAVGRSCRRQVLPSAEISNLPSAEVADKLPIRELPKEERGAPDVAYPPRPPVSKVKGQRRKPEVPMPDDFSPDDTAYAFGAKLGFDRSRVDAETINMRNDAEKNDKRWRSWQAALRTWLTHAKRFEERDAARGAGISRNGALPRQPDAPPGQQAWKTGEIITG